MTNCLGLNVDKVAHDMNHPVAHYVKQELKFPSFFDTWHGMKRSLYLVSSTSLPLPTVFYHCLYLISSASLSTWSLLPVPLYPLCSTCLSLPGLFVLCQGRRGRGGNCPPKCKIGGFDPPKWEAYLYYSSTLYGHQAYKWLY